MTLLKLYISYNYSDVSNITAKKEISYRKCFIMLGTKYHRYGTTILPAGEGETRTEWFKPNTLVI